MKDLYLSLGAAAGDGTGKYRVERSVQTHVEARAHRPPQLASERAVAVQNTISTAAHYNVTICTDIETHIIAFHLQ